MCLLLLLLVVAVFLSSNCLGVSNVRPDIAALHANFYEPSPEDLENVHQAFLRQNYETKKPSLPPRSDGSQVNPRAASVAQLADARSLVAAAQASQAVYNKWNTENPRFNVYRHKQPGEHPVRQEGAMPIPVLSKETLEAVKLVGDVDAQEMMDNGTFPNYANDRFKAHMEQQSSPFPSKIKRDNSGGYWLGKINHGGTMPFGSNSSYKVWRNVMDYGAKGDGVTDDTDAIQRAISDGGRCGANCAGSTVKSAVVYFPYAVYNVRKSIISYYDTQIVGEIAPSGYMPVIQVSSAFVGNGVFSSDVYLSDGKSEWYLNTANFYRSIRNFAIDLRLARQREIKGIHWQVAQATSLENIKIYMTDKASSSQVGIFGENGSGGWIADITIEGGKYGFLGGNQQYSVSGLAVREAKNGIGMIWDWAWSWTHLSLMDCDVGIDLTAPGSDSAMPVGSVMIVDSYFMNCTSAVRTYAFKSTTTQQGTTVLTFNNVALRACTYIVSFPDGTYLIQDVSNKTISYLQLGDVVANGTTSDGWKDFEVTRPAPLTVSVSDAYSASQNSFFRRPKPFYFQTQVSGVLDAKSVAKGDGKTDDAAALQTLINYSVKNNLILYIPGGSYMISTPIVIPSGTVIVGEGWSQLVAYGSKFANAKDPQPMVTVGNGDDGTVELQNLLFTSQGALPGLVLVQWNMKAKTQGSAALWDCHFRVGGAIGTNLQSGQCPKLSGGIKSECIAATMLMLTTPGSNGYFENMWAWVADHDIDNPAADVSNQIDVYVARGILIQSTGASWYRGTASEHSALYQYNLFDAKNVYMSIIQTESPYYQGAPTTQAPAPFGDYPKFQGDPAWDMCGSATISCSMAWALIIEDSDSIFIDGAGLYSWFQSYNQDCVNTMNCQQRLVNIFNAGRVFLNHLNTIGSIEIVTPAISNAYNTIKYAQDHLQATGYPWWATIATYYDSYGEVNLTTKPYPIKTGWVAFGDSYAAGIGAGKRLQTDENDGGCQRGTGSYPTILREIIKFSHNVQPNFQIVACSGETAQQFIDGKEKGKQIENWFPEDSDLGTCSFTGNDLAFGNIVAHCIMGYKSRTDCQSDITAAKKILEDSDKITELVYDVLDKIFAKASVHKPRFIVYWTGYPKFFTVKDTTCDTSYFHQWIYFGEYLTQKLRNQLNELSVKINDALQFAINRYNVGLPYPKVVFVSPEALGIYDDRRFCELGVNEPNKGQKDQNTVAFFYDDGYDDIPSEGEGFRLPAQESEAPSDWSTVFTNSGTCSTDGPDTTEPLDTLFCDVARAIANGSASAQDTANADITVTKNADGTVTVTASEVAYNKMFHPKTRANWHIAQAVNDAFRRN